MSNGKVILNGMSVDVEDYFQVSAMEPYVPRDTWDSIPVRVERNVQLLLRLFAERETHATFFVLGWIAERYPQLIRQIVDSGHELASHGYGHYRATDQTNTQFFEDITRSKKVLEDIAGTAVAGYRAPSFSICERNPWAFDSLLEAGYRYSSSVYPVHHDHYGMPEAPRFPYQSRPGLLEIPISTACFFGRNFPVGGGGFFRLLPYSVSKWAISTVHKRDNRPVVFYLHPWEVDPDQPRIKVRDIKTRIRHYLNLDKVEHRLGRLAGDFDWGRIDHAFREEIASAS